MRALRRWVFASRSLNAYVDDCAVPSNCQRLQSVPIAQTTDAEVLPSTRCPSIAGPPFARSRINSAAAGESGPLSTGSGDCSSQNHCVPQILVQSQLAGNLGDPPIRVDDQVRASSLLLRGGRTEDETEERPSKGVTFPQSQMSTTSETLTRPCSPAPCFASAPPHLVRSAPTLATPPPLAVALKRQKPPAHREEGPRWELQAA